MTSHDGANSLQPNVRWARAWPVNRHNGWIVKSFHFCSFGQWTGIPSLSDCGFAVCSRRRMDATKKRTRTPSSGIDWGHQTSDLDIQMLTPKRRGEMKNLMEKKSRRERRRWNIRIDPATPSWSVQPWANFSLAKYRRVRNGRCKSTAESYFCVLFIYWPMDGP